MIHMSKFYIHSNIINKEVNHNKKMIISHPVQVQKNALHYILKSCKLIQLKTKSSLYIFRHKV